MRQERNQRAPDLVGQHRPKQLQLPLPVRVADFSEVLRMKRMDVRVAGGEPLDLLP